MGFIGSLDVSKFLKNKTGLHIGVKPGLENSYFEKNP
jgi:hypothetical protein